MFFASVSKSISLKSCRPSPPPQFTPKSCDATRDSVGNLFEAVLEDKQWPDTGKDTHLG